MSGEAFKKAAADAAMAHVKDGMKLGLGTGSTAKYFVDGVGQLVAQGMSLTCVPTSEATRAQAETLEITLSTLDALGSLDLTVDGADELDDGLRLIKGGGGALLREKIVASASAEMIVIADASKHVATLGAFPLPIEVIEFAARTTVQAISDVCSELGLSGEINLRETDGKPFVTDSGNQVYDCHIGKIPDPEKLATALNAVCGVVEHGLFIGLATRAYIGTGDGVQTI
jgi:ribose 5-phosphate isomerase A